MVFSSNFLENLSLVFGERLELDRRGKMFCLCLVNGSSSGVWKAFGMSLGIGCCGKL